MSKQVMIHKGPRILPEKFKEVKSLFIVGVDIAKRSREAIVSGHVCGSKTKTRRKTTGTPLLNGILWMAMVSVVSTFEGLIVLG